MTDKKFVFVFILFKIIELNMPGKCLKGHILVNVGIKNGGWCCDGDTIYGKCLSGCTGFDQTDGWDCLRCEICDFDLCEKCHSPPCEVYILLSFFLHFWLFLLLKIVLVDIFGKIIL